MRNEFLFCPSCGTDAIAMEHQGPRRVRHDRNLRRAVVVFLLPILFLGYGVVVTVAPWFQNLSMNLDSTKVGLELQIGKQPSNWLNSTSTFMAKVSLPNNLSDSATLKLERLEGGMWIEQDSNEVTKSATVPLKHNFSNTGEQSLRVSLYSGSDLVQTSEVKSVTGVRVPKGPLEKEGDVLYRAFSKSEYDSLATLDCGSYCWAYWVSSPTQSTLTIWVEEKGRALTNKAKVTITEVGVLRKVILPTLGLGKTGSVSIDSRPATAEEIRQANEPEPRPNPTPNTGKNTPEGCEERAVLLLRYDQTVREGEIWGLNHSYGEGFFPRLEWESDMQRKKFKELHSKLASITEEFFRCNYKDQQLLKVESYSIWPSP
jgi:hypothetical protein